MITTLPKPRRKGSLLALLKAIGPIKLAPREQPGWTDRRTDDALRVASKSGRRRARRR